MISPIESPILLPIGLSRLESLTASFSSARIAVIGDLMLDRYTFGSVSRISPEAPVPVLEIEDEQARLGGAANVGNNIRGLSAMALMLGVVGDDTSGLILKGLFTDLGFPPDGIITDRSRPTTVKTRVIAGSQQMLRLDHEAKRDISQATEDRLLAVLEERIEDLDAIILEDYNKGVITRNVIQRVITLAKKHKRPVLVDPKAHNFFEYQGATVFKPNRKEVEDALMVRLDSDSDVEQAGHRLLDRLNAENVLLTLGEKGMMLFERSGDGTVAIPTRARQVADVSGAGDTVIACLAVAMACGATVRESALLANRAAGLVIEELGIVPIYRDQLIGAIMEDIQAQAA
ncbi:MAG: D-glycero-beta-D-manno-heptose-7-phosphate kinase [Bacteroidota bacterium]|nr:D-glycero-beta-D-manno-heptose-7-phosphate kinase [Bacteroidota bacterium]MDP4232569.1 D-glycero-beta-D-manno-heptose-7-phosphate kinase [Bacteroidota bacterium]MDP4242977.1 D-glycero-beta-D-manno-heptose-7-phosphate kinase [Bacteroidota bacterium]MDP4286448.1 D-glycero-beta-D-manno-heptose-7-phosphate kinase [Bacteroidota bacterium]